MKKRFRFAVVMLLLVFVITGCGKYTSSYNAVGFVHSNVSGSAFMNFYKFKGTIVFTLKCKEDGVIDYSAKLEKGSLKVYYDADGEKKELLSLGDGDSVNASLEDLPKGKVYIIVETDGKCKNGDLKFDVRK